MANKNEAGRNEAVIIAVAPAEIVDILQDAGFRARLLDNIKQPRVTSAVQGLEFSVDFVSQPDDQQRYVDFSFHCALRIDGELPEATLNRWNRARRFARLVRNERFLYVTMDVLLAGGVTTRHLRAQCELWDHLLREVVLHLQQPHQAAASAASGV
jgi:hypothetical protein